MYKIVKLSDFHIPFEDKSVIRVALNFIEEVGVNELVLDEVCDFYAISRFSKDPKRALELQSELDFTMDWLWQIRKRFPQMKITMVSSNHDMRLLSYVNNSAREFSSLRCLGFKELLHLFEMKIDYRSNYIYKKVLFKHGDIVRSDSSVTAKAEWMKEGMSGVSGHTHRLGMFFKTLRGGEYVWVEGGCMCKTKNVSYIEGTANWQNGLSMFFFDEKTDRFDPKIFPIIKGGIVWGNKIIGA